MSDTLSDKISKLQAKKAQIEEDAEGALETLRELQGVEQELEEARAKQKAQREDKVYDPVAAGKEMAKEKETDPIAFK